uniref:Endonuclease/exonuclease/phosphatase domain-containing protein n=1 Tax=Eptatretus burgeri TaxID=7764 RepID=A0A8C4QLM4_EPTBU
MKTLRQWERGKCRSVQVRVGTLNVGTMTGKGRELADMIERRKVDILCVQETKWMGSKARSMGGGFKLFYHGVDGRRNGVRVILKEDYVKRVLEARRVSDRVMSVKLEIEGVMMNVISAYAPHMGCQMEYKEDFWSELDEVVESVSKDERVVMMNVISAYAPHMGCEMEYKEDFWSELDEVVESVSKDERVVIGADFNGHVGEGNKEDEERRV